MNRRARRRAQPSVRGGPRRVVLSLIALVVVAAFVGLAIVRPASRAAPSPAVPGTRTPGAAAEAVTPSTLEQAVLEEVNRLRADPPAWARRLTDERRFFDGTLFERPGRIAVQTSEGWAAVDEAIGALEATPPLLPLAPSDGLARAARDHAVDLGSHGSRGHVGADGSTSRDRGERYGRFVGMFGEVISFGQEGAVEVVRQLIVDDGVADRGHRVNLLRPAFRVAGVACGSHRSMRMVCVIDLASTFEDGGR